nr:MAG TPA: hypothetical protein [Caudoviricetes sp.]
MICKKVFYFSNAYYNASLPEVQTYLLIYTSSLVHQLP